MAFGCDNYLELMALSQSSLRMDTQKWNNCQDIIFKPMVSIKNQVQGAAVGLESASMQHYDLFKSHGTDSVGRATYPEGFVH